MCASRSLIGAIQKLFKLKDGAKIWRRVFELSNAKGKDGSKAVSLSISIGGQVNAKR